MEIKGFTYGYDSHKGLLPTPEAYKSREALMDIGINWVCLAFAVNQKSYSSTEIYYDYAKNDSDLELIETINHFHERGVKVCLKPMINPSDGMWRALIDFPDETMFNENSYWSKWFRSYKAFMLHYAEIAEYTHCEMLCIGCEMLGTERREAEWRDVIAGIRALYNGPLTYNTNHGKEDLAKWYDAIDYLGTSAYFPVADKPNATMEEMSAEWEKIADRLEAKSKALGKKILFIEIGCRSAAGCATMPWDFTHREFPYSEDEQANFYESCIKTMSGRDWFMGFFWWDWSTRIYDKPEDAKKDDGFNIHFKKTEKLLKEWYSKL